MPVKVIAYDIGTTGVKTCLFEIGETVKLLEAASAGYELFLLENGGVEQEPDQWWEAMCGTTREVLEKTQISEEEIRGISFCAQMQGLVLVDPRGVPVRRAMSYMDSRGKSEMEETLCRGIKATGLNARKLLRSIQISGAVSASVKDPVWKYNWVKAHEPEIYAKVYKWLDVKDFLVCRCTGRFVMSRDSAFATLLYDTRNGGSGFSPEICKMMGVDMGHLPEICLSTDVAGGLLEKAADELGLAPGTPVFSGGGDAALIGIGAGATKKGATHIYMGTSGWVSTVTEKQRLDISSMISSIVGADPKSFNYFAELETAGKCLEWVKDHLALDETNLFLDKKPAWESPESVSKSLYDYMMEAIRDVPAGSGGVIFTPWLHGNRCPFEDPNARGMFFNIGIQTGKNEMIHAVVEGICYHLRWQLEAMEKKVKCGRVIRFAGGGALAPLTCQILADVLGRSIETVDSPQNAGAVGAAAVMAVGLGLADSIEACGELIDVTAVYRPREESKGVHYRHFEVFKALYKKNKAAFGQLHTER